MVFYLFLYVVLFSRWAYFVIREVIFRERIAVTPEES
jgi:hypothetical protein